MIRTHRDLKVWRRSIELAVQVYEATRTFPVTEQWGLAQQARRAAVSVASNIAEGSARGARAQFVQYLRVARGSLAELETQLILAKRLGLLADDLALEQELTAVGKMLSGLIRSLSPHE